VDKLERLISMDHGIRHQPSIESGQLPSVYAGECQEVTIGKVRRIEKTRRVYSFLIE
jgi:hypothetical protein